MQKIKIIVGIALALVMAIEIKGDNVVENRPKVGVGVLIIRDLKLLLGRRKNAHGNGTWAPPGGHLEFGETFEECAAREVMEETGLVITSVKQCAVTNDIFDSENKHYITIFMLAEQFVGEPELCEPDKCDVWQWFAFDQLPSPLFLPVQNLLEREKQLKFLN